MQFTWLWLHHYRTFNVLIYHTTRTIILCHILMNEATCAVYHFTLRAAGGCIAQRRFTPLEYLIFAVHCKTVPNVGEVFLASTGNVPVLPMANRLSLLRWKTKAHWVEGVKYYSLEVVICKQPEEKESIRRICNTPSRVRIVQTRILCRAGLERGFPAREAGALTRNAKGYSL